MIDAPYVSKRGRAVINCHESAANITRAYGIGNIAVSHFTPSEIKKEKLIVVRGGGISSRAVFARGDPQSFTRFSLKSDTAMVLGREHTSPS
jgi:hypothetical protein